MPIQQGAGQFNTGRDCTIVLRGPAGPVQIPNVVQFECKQETSEVKIKRMDGINLQSHLPNGWTWSLEFERGSVDVDVLIAQVEAAWYAAGVIGAFSLTQYITEAGGSTSDWQMDGVTVKLDDAGTWKGDASVRQKLSGWANRRIAV